MKTLPGTAKQQILVLQGYERGEPASERASGRSSRNGAFERTGVRADVPTVLSRGPAGPLERTREQANERTVLAGGVGEEGGASERASERTVFSQWCSPEDGGASELGPQQQI